MNKHSKTESHRYRKETSGCQRGGEFGNGRNRWGGLRDTNLELKSEWVTGVKCALWGV